MRKSTLIIAVAATLLASCNSNPGGSPQRSSSADTVQSFAKYVIDGKANESVVFLTVKDTFKLTSTDSTADHVTMAKKWVKDTTYFVPITDSLRDSARRPILDTLKKPKMQTKWYPWPRRFIIYDYHWHP